MVGYECAKGSTTKQTKHYLSLFSLFLNTQKSKRPSAGALGLLLLWSFASQKVFISGSAGYGVALVHDGVLARRRPHPTRLRRPTFPPGEGSVNAVQLCRVVPPKKAFPEGEGGCEADE